MSYDEQEFIYKLLNNQMIEENSCWVPHDQYYGQSEDSSLGNFIKDNLNSEYGIKNIVFRLYYCLVQHYHNNFYLEFRPSADGIVFILRGQPVFSDCYLNLIVKYTISFIPENCNLSCAFILPENPDFYFDKSLIMNYQDKSSLGFFEKLKKLADSDDNSQEIQQFLDSISLDNYVNNMSNLSGQQDRSGLSNVNDIQQSSYDSNVNEDSDTHKTENPVKNNNEADGNNNIDTIRKESSDKKDIEDDWSNASNSEYMIYCTECGEENYPLNTMCKKCNAPLVTYKIDYGNVINSFDELLTDDAVERIENTEIPISFYEYVKEIIVKKCDNIDFSEDINVYEKILRICRYYTNIIPNDQIGGYGEYNFNSIVFNPSFSRSQQCATLIKYLAVDIHIEIMEYLFMYIFDVKNNVYLKSLINFSRNNILELFIEKYYQVRVESHFIPEEYHNYEEIDRFYLDHVVYNKHFSEEIFVQNLIIGNSYAHEIISILEKVITEDIRNELADEFIYDNESKGNDLKSYESSELVDCEQILKTSKDSIVKTINYLRESEEARQELVEMKNIFENVVNS